MRERGASFAAILSSYITYVRTLCKFFLALKIFFWWSLSTECAAEKADKPLLSDSSDDDIFQRLLITSPGLPPPPPPPSNFRHFAITVVVTFVEDDVTQLGFPCPLAHTFTEREREREREMNLDKTRERKKERKAMQYGVPSKRNLALLVSFLPPFAVLLCLSQFDFDFLF